MMVLLSGEGPTDLGSCNNALGVCDGLNFTIGPMTVLISQLAEPILGYSLLAKPNSLKFLNKKTLCDYAKAMPKRLQPSRSKKKGVETGYFFANAMALGNLALDHELEMGEHVLAVLFRDSDGTHSTPNNQWDDKFESMRIGFLQSGFNNGVRMLPKPKSEVWLLSGASPNLHNCASLEDISGNDNSPNSAKKKLADALGGNKSCFELCDWLINNPLNLNKAITMPSFKAFKDELDLAMRRVFALC